MSKASFHLVELQAIYLTSLEDGKKQDAKQESIVLKVDVIHDQKSRMQEERCGYESLNVRIWRSTDKPDKERSVSDALRTGSCRTSLELPPRLVPSG
jgi:hypothetical protein